MEHFKQLLAFPLYATVVWLCWVIGNQTGVNGMAAVLAGCVLIAMALWFWGDHLLRRSLSAATAALALSVLGSPLLTTTPNDNNNHQQWQAYSEQTLTQLRQQKQAIFLNVTADWCITCLANEKVTLSSDRVQQTMAQEQVVYMKADWTNHDPAITQLLQQFNRSGVPLYVYFPAEPTQPGQVLPQLLTTDRVIAALEGS